MTMNFDFITKHKIFDINTASDVSLLAAAKCLEILHSFMQINLNDDKAYGKIDTHLLKMHDIFMELNNRVQKETSLEKQATYLKAMCEINSCSNYFYLGLPDKVLFQSLETFFETAQIYNPQATHISNDAHLAYLLYEISKNIVDTDLDDTDQCPEHTRFTEIIDSWLNNINNNGTWSEIDDTTAFHRLEVALQCFAYEDSPKEVAFNDLYRHYTSNANPQQASIQELLAMSKASFAMSQSLTPFSTSIATTATQRIATTPAQSDNWWTLQAILTQQWFATETHQIQSHLTP